MPPKPTHPQPKNKRHNLNMTPELKNRLVQSRRSSGNTMNGEIHSRLEATYDDPTLQIAAVLWPHLQKLDDEDRVKFAEMIVAMAKPRKKPS